MKNNVKILLSLLVASIPGCANDSVDANGYVWNGLNSASGAPDIEAIVVGGLAQIPEATIRIKGKHCSIAGSLIELGETTASASPSSLPGPDSSGQQGYAFEFTVDATEITGVQSGGGCFELKMEQNIPGQGWSPIATFDNESLICYNEETAIDPDLTYLDALEICRRDSDWLKYNFYFDIR